MLQILICDDDAIFALRLQSAVETLLENRRTAARIQVFHSAEAIGSETLRTCDLAFLDIDLGARRFNGLELGRRLRDAGGEAVIVFVTNYLEYAPEGYELRAFRYLLKDELDQKLEGCVRQALEQIRTEKSDWKIQTEGEQIAIPLRELAYVESMGHSLLCHVVEPGRTAERVYRCYGALGKAEEELAPRGFLRIQKSYLVNMAHLKKLSSAQALLTGGVSLPVSAKNYAACKRSYLLWKGRQ